MVGAMCIRVVDSSQEVCYPIHPASTSWSNFKPFISTRQKHTHSHPLLVSPTRTSRQRQTRRPRLLFSCLVKCLHQASAVAAAAGSSTRQAAGKLQASTRQATGKQQASSSGPAGKQKASSTRQAAASSSEQQAAASKQASRQAGKQASRQAGKQASRQAAATKQQQPSSSNQAAATKQQQPEAATKQQQPVYGPCIQKSNLFQAHDLKTVKSFNY